MSDGKRRPGASTMSATAQNDSLERRWPLYLKGLLFVLPPIVAWGFSCTFLVPKLRELYEVANLDLTTTGWLWRTPSVLIVLAQHALFVGILLVLILGGLEVLSRGYRHYRRTTVNILVWTINVAALVGLTNLLILAIWVAPGRL
jgi:hypothetical protein